jgi:hypothetical protein
MGERRRAYRVLVGKPGRKNRLEDTDVDGRVILRWNFKKGMWGMDWIDVVQDRDRWRVLVNVVINLRVP